MYDHELSVAIQQERERAIREARLHHRHDLVRKPSWLARLLMVIRPARRPASVRHVDSTNRTGTTTTHPGASGAATRACTGSSTTAHG
jgi:hypothetical protein